ncbi:hypothetical protein NL676_021550 [Syzygium grande]|nr:hypothetical protein NL676_021550 [Syzygium grande]
MGYTKDQLLTRLQELQIEFSKYEHPVVLTVEAQAKHVGNVGAALSKNLFLKDKKQRFYIVSALADTKVDLKGTQPVMQFNEFFCQRLGLGKGGLRLAPEEALGEILQVPLGCVTPFALVNESASHVSLLLDQGFKSQQGCLFHPLSNDTSISLNTFSLDMFLKSIGRDPSYVDLEANPKVGKDQPPDLAALVPSDSIVLPEFAEGELPSKPSDENHAATDVKPKAVKAKAVKTPAAAEKVKDKPSTEVLPSISFTDAGQFVEEILEKTSAIILSEIREDTVRQHGEQLGAVVSDTLRKRLSSELKNLAIMFKNTAYTEGFHAGTRHQPKRP